MFTFLRNLFKRKEPVRPHRHETSKESFITDASSNDRRGDSKVTNVPAANVPKPTPTKAPPPTPTPTPTSTSTPDSGSSLASDTALWASANYVPWTASPSVASTPKADTTYTSYSGSGGDSSYSSNSSSDSSSSSSCE